MWSISAIEVAHLRSPGGDRFTQFANALLRAEACVLGIPDTAIDTNARVNLPDGGVDSKVAVAAPHDPAGRFRVPTIWQFKATEAHLIRTPELAVEMSKPFVRECVAQGYGYRFAVCDSLTPEKKQEWESELTRLAREIHPDAPNVIVIAADDLEAWANRFPAVVLRFFRHELQWKAIHLDAWRMNARSTTREFVSVPDWEPVQQAIKRHVNMADTPAEAVLPIQGLAGVGKTRIVFETLGNMPEMEGLVLYTIDDQHAREIALAIANESSLHAVLVADECPVETRIQLAAVLHGHRARVRVVAIDNTGMYPSSGAGEYFLEKMPASILEQILERNFPAVPLDSRRRYASVASGFPRLAADLCNHHPEIVSQGLIGPATSRIDAYLWNRLRDQDQRILKALSLVTRVGFSGEVAEQLDGLCSLTGLDARSVREVANRLHSGPGFVGKAGRFFYVTPEIVAGIAFQSAWNLWAADDREHFFRGIRPSLLEAFLERVSRSATEDVRRIVTEFFFHHWAARLQPKDLSDSAEVDRLVILVETEPHRYLPLVKKLVEQATSDELRAISGEGAGRWGPRRHLVWLAERLAAFPDHFDDSECILLRLALAESEPRISNNATAIWMRLFRIHLSGSAMPFAERLERLRTRIHSQDADTSSLALSALEKALEMRVTRLAGRPLVAGRIPPPEWNPETIQEESGCVDAVVSVLCELADSDLPRLRSAASSIAISRMRLLLQRQHLESVKRIIAADLSNSTRTGAVTAIADFIRFDCTSDSPDPPPQGYRARVLEWLQSLKPADLHGRLVVAVGVDPWRYWRGEEETAWRAELQTLARDLCRNPTLLADELAWLCSPEAKSAAELGQEIGTQDPEGTFLEMAVESALHHESTAFARGYIHGLLRSTRLLREKLNSLLDRAQESAPALAYELFSVGGDQTNALERTFRLVDEGKLPALYLQGFSMGVGSRPLQTSEFQGALGRLLAAIEQGESRATEVAIRFVGYRLEKERESPDGRVLEQQEILALLWRLVEMTAPDAGTESFWWARILQSLTLSEPDRAARIAVAALAGRNFEQQDEAQNILALMAPEHSHVVMNRLGEWILHEEGGWRSYIEDYRSLIHSLPSEVVERWIRENGTEAARRLARHLPKPGLGAKGESVIPPLTEFVLTTFEEDERVFNEFCAGIHSGQVYIGDMAVHKEAEGEFASKFLNHPLRRIREWAERETAYARQAAEHFRVRQEEMQLE